MKSTIKLFLILLSLAGSTAARGQNTALLNALRDSLVIYSTKLSLQHPQAERLKADQRIATLLSKAIKQQKSIDYSFDTLRYISVLTSDDNKLRFFTWAVPMDDGSYQYRGLVQAWVKRNKAYRLITLHDNSQHIHSPMKKTLNAKKWYGAFYYQLITRKYHRKSYYTLLGWKGIDATRTTRVIETVNLKSNGDLVFGSSIFQIKDFSYFERNKRPKRLIFTYASGADMILRYEQQTILKQVRQSKIKSSPLGSGFNAQKKEVRSKPRYKKLKGKVIVMDRLIVTNKELEGMYQFYIPAANIIDALRFEKGKWKYYPDIDARNKGNSPSRKNTIHYDLLPEEED